MRFPFGASPGTLNQGIDSLVLPPLLCCFTSSQGENYFPQNSIGDAVTPCCDNVQWCKVSSEAKLFLMQISTESCGWELCGRWSRPRLYQKVGKGNYDNGLYWEIKMAVIVSCTGKSGLLKASRMGKVKDVGSLCCWVCACVLVC